MQLKPMKREFAFPQTVGLISTISPDGVRNAAPYSNITPILRPNDLICVASWHKRDTLRNIRDTGEFVVNIPSIGLVEAVVPTARHYPPEVDELLEAGLQPRASKTVRPPGIEGCLAWIECTLHRQYIEKEYVLLIGRVQHLEMDDRFLDEQEGLDPARAEPLMVLLNRGGMRFVTVRDTGRFASYGSMFPDGHDPLEHLYTEAKPVKEEGDRP